MKNTMKKAFTLIELLVVITIIWILATGATSIYTSQIQKARDTTRINDIKALQWWIEQFYQDNTIYPQGWADWNVANSWVQSYIPKLAQDPKHDQTCINSRCWYIYWVWNDPNWIEQWAYEISAAFENKWNHDNKAANSSDNWNDIARLELWVPALPLIDTKQDKDTKFNWIAIPTSDTTENIIVIMKNAVVTK